MRAVNGSDVALQVTNRRTEAKQNKSNEGLPDKHDNITVNSAHLAVAHY